MLSPLSFQWAGRTIALGTFPAAEAEEKCAEAKDLTRKWRSTIRPRPTREWVILELERLGVRVVTGGRAGRTADRSKKEEKEKESQAPKSAGKERMNSLGWAAGADPGDFDAMMQRRSSSIGYSMMDGDFRRRGSSLGLGQMQNFGIEDASVPPHRPLVGGASAAAYEAARADHYNNLAAKKRLSGESPRRSSLGGLGMMSASGVGGGLSLSGASNQHYEMLKLHHMNLLNEIQETTLMMNLYQQQQLQQQREALQEQEKLETQRSRGTPQAKMSPQERNSEYGSMYGGGGMQGGFAGEARGIGGMMEGMGRSPSIGMGGTGSGMGRSPSLGMGSSVGRSFSLGLGSIGGMSDVEQRQDAMKQQTSEEERPSDKKSLDQDLQAQEEEQRLLEERLRKIKAEIAQRQREAEALEASFGDQDGATEKRKSAGSDERHGMEEDVSARKKRKSYSSGVASCEV